MNIKDQVCSFELAKRLHKLGVKQRSLFSWQIEDEKSPILNISFMGALKSTDYSAFTVAELGEMLPRTLKWPDGTYALQEYFYADGLYSIYYAFNRYAPIDFLDEKEADARAKMLIYLLEKGFEV